ncbi:MAG: aminoacyl-tRNA hydrolase [Gemmatimonadaceae bacterium]
MKLVVGLGNPGREYENTRHNVGWMLLDRLAAEWRVQGWRASRVSEARIADAIVDGTRVRLLKPLTYMNVSGAALRPYVRRASWSGASDLFVIVDDVALALGRYRLRAQGSAGGHNGLLSIEKALGSRVYARLRIGIAPVERVPVAAADSLADFVLAPFGKRERAEIDALLPRLVDAVGIWLREGIVRAMNVHNRRPSPDPAGPEDAPAS